VKPQGRHHAQAMIQSPRLFSDEKGSGKEGEGGQERGVLVRVTGESPPAGGEETSTTFGLEGLEVCSY
jgi:hypothetical protein